MLAQHGDGSFARTTHQPVRNWNTPQAWQEVINDEKKTVWS